MTRKHFKMIAEAINASRGNPEADPALTTAAVLLAIRLQAENPRFDASKFLTACGVTA